MIEDLCAWFDSHARDLPWRRNRKGYTALVSEIMLQQTQVSRVVDCYKRFMRAFPTVGALARADEQCVLQHWQGMGYYRRARNLHAAAIMIVREFNSQIPRRAAELRRLPGVGRYTAGAIASIVFGESEPIVDGNVERVLLRISAKRKHDRAKPRASTDADLRAWAWQRAAHLVALADRPGTLNEALMELGATICLPSPAKPRCDACPAARWCEARKHGLQQTIPTPKLRAQPTTTHHHAVVVTRGRSRHVLLEQRDASGMWAGLWQTPTIEADSCLKPAEIRKTMRTPIVGPLRPCGSFVHKTTHRTIHFHVFAGTTRLRRGVWRHLDGLDIDLPMSSAHRRVLRLAGPAMPSSERHLKG